MATPRQSPERGGSQSRRRSFWVDPRFLIGIALVVISVLGVDALVNAANASTEVLAARSTLTPGERVHASDLVPTSVRVGHTAGFYLRATDVPSDGVVVTRVVAAGELVPHSAIGSEAGRSLTSIVVSVSSALAASIGPGARVDLWASQQADAADDGASSATSADGGAGAYAAPTVLVSSAIVVRLVDQKTLVASNGSSVELLMPKSATASVLDAIANGAVLDVLPVDLPIGQ
jgi:hypothetical protein